MVTVRILVTKVVEVRVVPGEPPARSGEERRVQHLAVVRGRVVVGCEVRADAELLEHDRLAEAPGELAPEGGREELTDLVVLHRVDVRAEEVDERRECAQGVAVVLAGDLDAPRAVPDRDRLGGACRPHGLDEDACPGGDLLGARAAAVERHLVRQEPTGYGVTVEAAGDLPDEPRLLRHEPHVAVEVAIPPPGRIPVLSGHVADDERGDRLQPLLRVRVEEIGEPVEHLFVELLRLRDEVGPVAERACDGAAVLGENRELLPHDRGVVPHPHAGPAGARPEVRTDPGTPCAL